MASEYPLTKAPSRFPASSSEKLGSTALERNQSPMEKYFGSNRVECYDTLPQYDERLLADLEVLVE